ncbi:MAG: hypothetical protein MZW92_11615 [Comamonadaceae bacterium]|nr:hypothetical protein [Comamonadaceae bacterium]
MWWFHSTSAISAMPMGMPGWPDLAFSTASMARARMALVRLLNTGASKSAKVDVIVHSLRICPAKGAIIAQAGPF